MAVKTSIDLLSEPPFETPMTVIYVDILGEGINDDDDYKNQTQELSMQLTATNSPDCGSSG